MTKAEDWISLIMLRSEKNDENDLQILNCSLDSVIRITSERVVKFWLMPDPIFRLSRYHSPYQTSKAKMNGFLDKIMSLNESEYQKGKKAVHRKPRPYLDKLYETRATMTYEEARESVYAFFGAGFDTSGKAIPCVLFLLALNQEAQEKLFDELEITLIDGKIDEESLSKMKFLDAVIKESLRLLPIAIFLAREAKNDIKLSE